MHGAGPMQPSHWARLLALKSCVVFACWNLWTAISKDRSNRRMSIGIDRGNKELNM